MKKKTKNKVVKTAAPKKAPLTKSLAELMKDEDGFVSKETILKVGLSTVAALGVVGSLTDIASGQLNQSTHSNSIATSATDPSLAPNCAQHTNVTTHSSY